MVPIRAEGETRVGRTLSDLTTKRAIMVMFSVMISIPLLDYATYFQDLSAFESGLQLLESAFLTAHPIELPERIFYLALNSSSAPMLQLQVDTLTLLDVTIDPSLRDEELK